MKNTWNPIWIGAIRLVIFVMLLLPLPTMAQIDDNGEKAKTFTQEQLAQLLAPIALYPDELIAQVLLAATYPLEIVMADRWVQQNKNLKGTELANALELETWDPSVKALVNFPTVLAMLNQKLDLTTKIGDAFLEQKEDVMDMIQELRKKAVEAGNLKSTREQKVVAEDDKVIIEPADSRIIYVPTYDPYLVYGPWWYPAYPPYYFYPPPYPGVFFSFGIGVTLGMPWGYAWGGWDWYNNNIYININRNLSYNRYINRSRYIRNYERRGQSIRSGQVSWQHDPGHRRGVAYKDKVTAQKFGQLPGRRGEVRPESRGYMPTGRPAPGSRGGEVGSGSGRRTITPSGGAERKIRRDIDSSGRSVAPKATRDSAFTGGYSDGTRTRKFSERGSQSTGGSNAYRSGNIVQPGRGSSVGISRGGSRDSAPRAGDRSDDKRR